MDLFLLELLQQLENRISVYPVPTRDILYLKGIAGSKEIQIFDILGKTVSVQKITNTVNTFGLTKGVYLLSVDNQMVRFIKE